MILGLESFRPSAITRHAFLLGMAGLFLPVFAWLEAQEVSPLKESTPDVKSALTSVVSQQVAAFRSSDYVKAYTFAAKPIQAMYGVAEFEKMVKIGYPIIPSSVSTEFGIVLDDGEDGVVLVHLTDDKGRKQLLRYTLRKFPEGWKIMGVTAADETQQVAPLSA